MREAKRLEVGARVQVISQHWLRGRDTGEIIRIERQGRNKWLIQFDISYPGGGIDGDKLWLDQSHLSVLTDNEYEQFGHRSEQADERSMSIDFRQ
jgi:hypothetical protein